MTTLGHEPVRVDRVVAIDGPLGPALALGIHASVIALEEVGHNRRDHDVIAVADGLHASPPRDLFTVNELTVQPPPRPFAARPTVACTVRGELVAEGKTQPHGGRDVCLPCFLTMSR